MFDQENKGMFDQDGKEKAIAVVNSDGILICPRCGFDYIHHGRVTVIEREDGEDSDGVITQVEGNKALTTPLPADKTPGRRNGLTISCFCEECTDRDPVTSEQKYDLMLHIAQHKGNTHMGWTWWEPQSKGT